MNIEENKWTGLSANEAAKRLGDRGVNELPSQRRLGVLTIFINVIREPMLLLLVACGVIYLLLGSPSDAWMLLTFVFVVMGITFYQERKTERALEALKRIVSPVALVIRDGVERKVASRELVFDDVIRIREGDRIPADGTVLEATNLLIDESILTGESIPVRKSVWNGYTTKLAPGGEDLPFVFSGTLVTQGRAVVRITATGVYTEIGHIGKSLQRITDEDTLLQKETARIVRNFAIIGIILCAVVVVVYGYQHGDWIKGILSGLTLSMALLPEEFSVVLVIFLTLGAWHMSKKNVLVRKTPAIETLGAATVVCVDKTGTITENKMLLEGVLVGNAFHEIHASNKQALTKGCTTVLEYAVLASQKNPFDPLEKEILTKGQIYAAKILARYNDWSVVREYPLSKELLAISHVWKSPVGRESVVAAKGAPEAIIDLCHLDSTDSEKITGKIQELSGLGYRIIGVAGATLSSQGIAAGQHDYPFQFLGLMVFRDPVRTGVLQSVEECYRAGVRIIMITGDYPGTAMCIARQIGLKNAGECVTGQDLLKMSQDKLQETIRSVNIFARVVPEQKLLLVNALKANGEIVAMTGDGVNDAPALKSAHVGISMGERGTDVARESSDIILLNDDFSSIVAAIRMGRKIFDNLKKAMMYIVAVHIPIAGMSLFPILFNLPIVLLPSHIAFLELIIDPACSIVFEAEKEEQMIMDRPPRSLKDPLFGTNAFILSFLQGLGTLIATFAVYLIGLSHGLGENEARSLAFVTIVIGNILLIITNLSVKENFITILKNKNTALYGVAGAAVVSLFFVLYVPFFRGIFHFNILHWNDLILCFVSAAISILWFEGYKFLRR